MEADRKAAALREDLIKAEQRTKLQLLTAPVDGAVQQLSVHTIGGVVTPAQALLVVVPADSRLEIEAMVSNRDIGFIHVGQEVEIKVDAFNFTRYGLLHGTVLSISQDAITRDKPQDKSADTAGGATNATSEPKGQELVYAARVSLDRTQMQVDENIVNLSPGMAVTVEIKTGSRAVSATSPSTLQYATVGSVAAGEAGNRSVTAEAMRAGPLGRPISTGSMLRPASAAQGAAPCANAVGGPALTPRTEAATAAARRSRQQFGVRQNVIGLSCRKLRVN